MKSKNLIMGLILVLLGTLLLLNNLGYITWSVWKSLIDLWPLILVVSGINIIFNKSKGIVAITWLLFFAILIGYGFYMQTQHSDMLSRFGKDFSLEILPETTRGIVDFKLGGGELELLPADSKLLTARISNAIINHQLHYSGGGKTAKIDIKQRVPNRISVNEKAYYSFMLNRRLVWEIEGDIGAVKGTLDLKDLMVEKLDLNVGAADLEILFGNLHHQTNVDIDAGASNLKLVIPVDVGARIKAEGLLKDIDLNGLNWQHEGKYYLSPNYHESDKKLDIQINMAAGKLEISQLNPENI